MQLQNIQTCLSKTFFHRSFGVRWAIVMLPNKILYSTQALVWRNLGEYAYTYQNYFFQLITQNIPVPTVAE